jgi:hypothetical protein
LVIARIRNRISNARTEYIECAKKFNCDRLTEEEIKSSYVERQKRTFQRPHGQSVADWEEVKNKYGRNSSEEKKKRKI